MGKAKLENVEVLNLCSQILKLDDPSPRNLSMAITAVIDSEIKANDLQPYLKARKNGTALICITGLPGAGKSTLVNCLIKDKLLSQGRIAILAIDPSSKLGGAFLGDRIRFTDIGDGERIFFRSIGHRGCQTILPHNIDAIAATFFHFGFNLVIVETVGLGQTQCEIPEIFDKVINVQTYTNGDEIQFSKSGLSEVGDIIFLNKADQIQKIGLAAGYQEIVNSRTSNAYGSTKVLTGSALTEDGVDELLIEIRKLVELET